MFASRSPPPMPKSILRVASPDGSRPPPRHIRSYSTSSPNPNPTQSPIGPMVSPDSPGPISPTFPFQPAFAPITAESEPDSQPTSPICRPMSPGATVRFAKATVHRVDVGPGRRFMPVKRRSKSTLTYISPLDPGTQPKVTLQSPTKLRRHHENQAAMGRYWMRTEEEEARERQEMERRAAEEAERYRNEPSSPGATSPSMSLPGSPPSHESQRPSWAERLAAIDKLSPLDSIPPLDKPEPEVEDKLETEEASDSEESTADSDGGASTATDKEEPEAEGMEADRHGDEAEGLGLAVALEPEDGEKSGTGRTTDENPGVEEAKAAVESEKGRQEEQKAGRSGAPLTPHAGEKTAAGTNTETSTETSETQPTAPTAQPGTETRTELPPATQTEPSGTKPAAEKPAAEKNPGSEATQGASLTPPKAETPQAQAITTTPATKPTQPAAAAAAARSASAAKVAAAPATVTRTTTQAHTPTAISIKRHSAPLFERPTSPMAIRPHSMMSMASMTLGPASPPTKANQLRLANRRSSSRRRPAYGEEHKREITA
ncbi:hypothetical protein B0H67DRAFT_577154 [Lasiosphaeris hirsuta]|uniref:Uncharacterized protein n=1 Tax=Lasiosphaeris hirsuta TaxID=260670 RepID=A0AA40ARP5_9PEZI|nr:hypothetical protein B0H67DRAFT_577154 [Lasiosphaeris hirsuta]